MLDQVGFILGRDARHNTLRVNNIQHWLTSSHKPGFLLSLDEEKAFNRMAWDFMNKTLKAIGLGDQILHFVQALYSAPTARVRVNSHLSNAFSISNDTPQGCPLSPLIFVLTLKPLLRHIRMNPDIKVIMIASQTHKLVAFVVPIRTPYHNPKSS